jgi:adenylate kinase
MKRTQMESGNADAWKGQGPPVPLVPAAKNSPELEIKDAQLIFGAVWRELEGELGRSRMRFPRELILLGGAPGAGKGTNSDFIRKVRGIDAPPIVVSQLLDTPEARAVKARGGMVGDREVVGILVRKLLEPEQQNGTLLDGFPRTKVQVECLKLLFDEMIALRREFYGTPEVIHFGSRSSRSWCCSSTRRESARAPTRDARLSPTTRRSPARV